MKKTQAGGEILAEKYSYYMILFSFDVKPRII